ncbi:MAG: hypothetical protein IT348_11820, partial [Candidatus Eisenbacteria bacterium]|nr:hypothetical protein [Candidatus Eisenbacteria bacterium]
MTPLDVQGRADQAFDALDRKLDEFDASSRARGVAYERQSRVGAIRFEPGRLMAQVRGTQFYKVAWIWRGDEWTPECDCPVGPWCKHSYALGVSIVELSLDDEGIARPALETLFGAPIAGGPAIGKPVAARPLPAPSPRPQLRPAPPRASLDELRTHPSEFQRAVLLGKLLREADLSDEGVYGDEFRDILRIPDADVMCWTLAQVLLRRPGGRLPAALEPFRDRDDLATHAAVLARAEIQRELMRWAANRPQDSERSLRLELTLAPARAHGAVVVPVPRVTTLRMNDEPRTIDQLRPMQSKSRRDPGHLSAPHTDLLESLIQYQNQERSVSFSIPSTGANTPMARLLYSLLPSADVRWSATLEHSEAANAGIVAGEVVRFDPRPARLLPALTPEADGESASLSLAASWPDGRQVPMARTLVLHARSGGATELPFAVVCDGVLSPLAGSLPDSLLRMLLRTREVQVPRAEAAPFVRALGRAMPDAAAQLGALAAVHPVQPTVAITLDERDRLGIRVLAHTRGAVWPPQGAMAPGEHLFELGADGHWNELVSGDDTSPESEVTPLTPVSDASPEDPAASVAPAGRANAWLHTPEPACVAPVLEWLRTTGAKANVRDALEAPWGVVLSPRTVGALAEAWERRPAGVRWLGDRRAQALLGSGHALRPRVSAKR